MHAPAMPAPIPEPTALPEDQADAAADAARAFASLLEGANGPVALGTSDGHTVQVPAAALGLFIDVLTALGNGDGVVVVPEHAELSTQQAADLLNVSRPFLVELLEAGSSRGARSGATAACCCATRWPTDAATTTSASACWPSSRRRDRTSASGTDDRGVHGRLRRQRPLPGAVA